MMKWSSWTLSDSIQESALRPLLIASFKSSFGFPADGCRLPTASLQLACHIQVVLLNSSQERLDDLYTAESLFLPKPSSDLHLIQNTFVVHMALN
jgi:hypothetical protein